MPLTPVESRVLASIDEDALVSSLVELIRVPSVTGTDAESELQHSQASTLEELGLDVDAWKFDLELLRSHPLYPGDETDRPGDVRFAHAPREQVDLDELISVTRSLALLAVRQCGGKL